MLVVPRQHADVQKPTLSQLLTICKGQSLIPKVEGWVQGTARRLPNCPSCGKMVRFDADKQDYVCDHCGLDDGIAKGPITNQVAKHNLITREFLHRLAYYWYNGLSNLNSMYVGISNDDTEVHELKSVFENTINGTRSQSATAAKNTVSEYYTYTTTFAAPGANRTIRQIGLLQKESGFAKAAYSSIWYQQLGASITKLSSPIIQTTAETFEVVYKYQFSQVTP